MKSLILSGGGARCAYHIGVLRGIRRVLRFSGADTQRLPFDVISGSSGGAINAVALASYPLHFGLALKQLFADWSALRPKDVYSRLLLRHYFARKGRHADVQSRYLLSNAPLSALLERTVDFSAIHRAVLNRSLYALIISAFSYATQQQVSFIDTLASYDPWSYEHSFSVSMPLTSAHVLASSAIPFVFPPQEILLPNGQRFFLGDGAIRELSPLYASVRLGVRRFLIIGADKSQVSMQTPTEPVSWGGLARSFFSSTFLRALSADCAQLEWLREPVRVLSFLPSQDPMDFVSSVKKIPRSVRLLARLLSGEEDHFLLSHFLFESEFLSRLLSLGEYDALSRAEEIVAFFAD